MAPCNDGDSFRVYPQRWWILFLYSSLSCFQGGCWAIPGGIPTSLQQIYPGLSGDDVQLLLNYGPAAFLASVLLWALVLDRNNGLRRCLVFANLCVVAGSVCRLLATSPTSATSRRLLSAGFILNALSGPISMGAPSKVAESWFAPNERGFATALSSMANLLGCVIGFAVAPAMVPPGSTITDLTRFNVLMLALTGACFLATVVYVPSHPPTPPSKSAAENSHGAGKSAAAGGLVPLYRDVCKLCSNRDFLVVAAAYAIANGLASGWSGALDLNVDRVGIDETTSGWLVFAGTIAGAITGTVLGKLIDRFRCHRWALIGCLALTALFAVYFSLLTAKVITSSSQRATLAQVALATTGCSAFYNGLVPVAFEIAVEASYTQKVGEGTVLLLMTSLNSLATFVLLFVPLQSAANLFNWLFVGGAALVTLTTILFLRDANARFADDTAASKGTSGDGDDVAVAAAIEAPFEPSGSAAAFGATVPLLLSVQQG